ncbi:MAG: hypothetical protein ACLTA2_08070 [[Clostridium] innocuum]
MKGKNIRKGITSVAILSLVLCLMSTGVMHAEDDETVFTPSQDQSAEEKTAAGEQEKQTVSDTTEEQQQTPVSENQSTSAATEEEDEKQESLEPVGKTESSIEEKDTALTEKMQDSTVGSTLEGNTGEQQDKADKQEEKAANINRFRAAMSSSYSGDLVFQDQSDTVSSEIRKKTENGKTVYTLYVTIQEGVVGDQIIDLGTKAVELFDKEIYSPGDSASYSVVIENHSGKSYKYKDNSFIVTTPNAEGYGVKPDPNYQVIGFDGQELPIKFLAARAYNDALVKLYGVSGTAQLSLRHLLGVYKKLETDGYNGKTYTGSEALSRFYLDFYNNKYGSAAKELYELPTDAIVDIQGGYGIANSTWVTITTTELNSLESEYGEIIDKYLAVKNVSSKNVSVQLKEMEPQLSATGYTFFYRELLHVAYGGESTVKDFLSKSPKWTGNNTAIGNYMANTNGIRDSVNKYMRDNAVLNTNDSLKADQILGSDDGSKMVLHSAFALDGPHMGNAYMSYQFAWYNTITLEEAEEPVGNIQVNKTFNKEAVDFAQGDPIFILKAENINTKDTYYKLVRFHENSAATQSVSFHNLPIGTYRISEMMGIRYDFGNVSVTSRENCAVIDGQSVTVDLNAAVADKEEAAADITFSNVRVNDTYLSDSDTVVNRFRVENGEVSTVTQDYLK